MTENNAAVLGAVLQQLDGDLDPAAIARIGEDALRRMDRWQQVRVALSAGPSPAVEPPPDPGRLTVALRFNGQQFGQIELADPAPQAATPAELGGVRVLAGILALALNNAWGAAESQRAQAALRERQQKLASLLEILPVGVSILDADRRLVFQNPALERILEIDRAGLESGAYRARTYLGADGSPLAPADFASARAAASREPVTNFETGVVKEDGRTIWTSVSALPVDFPDWKTVIVTVDITGRKQAESEHLRLAERLDLAARSAGIGIWDWDIQKNELVWDEQMYRLYGLQPGEFGGAYQAWLQGLHPDDREPSNARVMQAVHGEREFDTEFRVLWPDGSVHWLQSNGQVFHDESGAALRMVGVNYDISERKALEDSLRESEQRYSLLFEKSAVPTVLLKLPEVVIVDANEAAEKLTGFSRQEMQGKTSVELGLARPAERAQTISRFEQHGALQGRELRLVTRSGEERFVVVNTVPVTMNGLPYAISTMLDVTARKQAEEALQESEHLLREAQRIAHIGSWEWNLRSGETRWSAENYAIHGLDPGEPALTAEGLIKTIHPDDLEKVNAVISQAIAAGQQANLDYRIFRPDGSLRVIHAVGKVVEFDAEGNPCLMVGTNQDITERAQAEAALRQSQQNFLQAFDANPAALAITRRADGRFMRVNGAYTRLLGFTAEDVAGRTGQEINVYVNYADRQEVLRRLGEQGFVHDLEMQFRTKSGELRSLVLSLESLQFEGQDCIISALLDITERKRLEDELRRSNADLEQFAFIASHDLQEPLRGVAGMVELLRQQYQGRLDERADTYIALAVEGAQRMQQLINDLLQFSRVNRLGQPFVALQLEDALQTALTNLQAAIQESQAQITWDPLPVVVGDPLQLAQVFQNLLGNAIKFRSPERPPQIHIGAQRVTSADRGEEQRWQIAVSDNGIGIKSQYFERIFLVFQRLHSRRAYPGTGIGLALCQKIIIRHGGQIWVESIPGQGSTFYFTLAVKNTTMEAA